MKTDWPQSNALKRACRNDKRSRLLEHGESQHNPEGEEPEG